MTDEARERRYLLWGIPASLILHVLILAFLNYGLPTLPQHPQEEQPLNVALVPPPEQPKPKPPPPKPETKAEKPPEPKPEKPPEERKPPDGEALKRVFQYGAKDTGPKKSLDGGSAQDNAPPPADSSKTHGTPKAEENKPAAAAAPPPQQTEPDKTDAKPAETDAKPTPNEDKQPPDNADRPTDQQEPSPRPAEKQAVETPKPSPVETAKPAPEKAKPKPLRSMKFSTANAKPSKPKSSKSRGTSPSAPDSADTAAGGTPVYGGLPGVRKLFSQGATGDALATSSMDGVPRDRRIANLCANVLDTELQGASYSPKWLPTIPLKTGNVLSPAEAAFSTRTTWYRLSFRCEVDSDATRVLSFSFRVGAEIPRGEWPPGHPL